MKDLYCPVCQGRGWEFIAPHPGESAGDTMDCPQCAGLGVYDPNVQVLSPGQLPDEKADILALRTSVWRKDPAWGTPSMRPHGRPDQKVVLMIDDQYGGDFSWIGGVVDGLTLFKEDILDAVRSLWYTWIRIQTLAPMAMGAVSMDEFEEHVKQATLPSNDPHKRD